MLIATRFPTDDAADGTTVLDRSALLSEVLGSLLGTLLFHATADLDEIASTEAAIGRLVDRIGDHSVGVSLDIGGGAAVIEVTVPEDPAPTGARGGPMPPDTVVLGPSRRTVGEQIDAYLDELGRSVHLERLRIVIDAP